MVGACLFAFDLFYILSQSNLECENRRMFRLIRKRCTEKLYNTCDLSIMRVSVTAAASITRSNSFPTNPFTDIEKDVKKKRRVWI